LANMTSSAVGEIWCEEEEEGCMKLQGNNLRRSNILAGPNTSDMSIGLHANTGMLCRATASEYTVILG